MFYEAKLILCKCWTVLFYTCTGSLNVHTHSYVMGVCVCTFSDNDKIDPTKDNSGLIPYLHICCASMNKIASFSSLWPGNTIWRHGSGSTLVQFMACGLTAPCHYLDESCLATSDDWCIHLGPMSKECLKCLSLLERAEARQWEWQCNVLKFKKAIWKQVIWEEK